MQSTSARVSQHNIDKSTLKSIERTNEFIPDISSPSSYTKSGFHALRDNDTLNPNQDQMTSLKCILLGDCNVGKSSVVVSYTSNGFPDNHKSTAFDIYKVEINVEDRRVQLQICDTGGGEEVSSLRYLAYPDCHTFILCFSVIDPSSFYNLINHWFKEIQPFVSVNKATVLLVGCRCDERNNVSHIIDLSAHGEGPITEQIVRRYNDQLGADAYIECSALTQKNLKRVFDLAIWYSMRVYDRCLIAEQQRLVKLTNNKKRLKKRRLPGVEMCNNYYNNDWKMKSSIVDNESKSFWKRLFCLS